MMEKNSFSTPSFIISITLFLLKYPGESFSSDVSVSPSGSSTLLPPLTANNDSGSDVHNGSTLVPTSSPTTTPDLSYLEVCPDNAPCENLGAECISCQMNHYCVYGTTETAVCVVKQNLTCIGNRTFIRPYECRYAYQLDQDMVTCSIATATGCEMKKAPPDTYYAPCTVKEDVLCLGNRTFYKKFPCNWTRGYKWSTALALSVTLGGFGVDRFYLGLWREALGKLFSFGGLGVWTVVDVILIAVGYVGPHDSSVYIYPWD